MDTADPNWTKGIAKPLRELLEGGASDDDLDRFLCAHRDGDVELAQTLLSATRLVTQATTPAHSGLSTATALANLRTAALRPVVNDLTAQELHFYVHFVIYASELLVANHPDDAMWTSGAVIEAAAASLKQAALDTMRTR
jgi:hypothetical protein